MKKAAAYLRYSSDNQNYGSIEAQKRAIDEFCKRESIYIVKYYIDEAESATTDNRPQFINMIKDSSLKMFDCIVVHKLDRFARNRYDSAIHGKTLKQKNVRLISVLENFDDSPESIMLVSVLEGMAEYYSKNLGREVKKGMKETALKAEHNGGIPPLGFDVIDRKYVINPIEADTVKIIMTMYANGEGYSTILDELKSKGRKTKYGKQFGKNSLHDILKNEKYIGTYIFNRSVSKSEDGKRNHHASKDESEIIRKENALPVIIDMETWERVQIRMNSNLHKTLHAKEIYLLSGLIQCGLCGGSMCGNRLTKNDKVYSYYECSAHKQTKTCDMKRVKKEYIENEVLKAIEQYLFTDQAIDIIVKDIQIELQETNRTADEDIRNLKSLISDIDIKANNIVDIIANGQGNAFLMEKLDTLEQQKNGYQSMIDEITAKSEVTVLGEPEIRGYLASHKNFNRNSDSTKKNILQTFVEKVIVYPDKAEIHFKLGTEWWRRTVQVQLPNILK